MLTKRDDKKNCIKKGGTFHIYILQGVSEKVLSHFVKGKVSLRKG